MAGGLRPRAPDAAARCAPRRELGSQRVETPGEQARRTLGCATTTSKPRRRIDLTLSTRGLSMPENGTSTSTQRASRGPWAMRSSSSLASQPATAGWISPPGWTLSLSVEGGLEHFRAWEAIDATSRGKAGWPTCGVTVASHTPSRDLSLR